MINLWLCHAEFISASLANASNLAIEIPKQVRDDTNKKYMSSKANILKKFRRWLRQGEARRIIPSRDNLSIQVGKLLSTRGSELITMTTLWLAQKKHHFRSLRSRKVMLKRNS